MVNPDYQPHEELLSDVDEYLTERDFCIDSNPYHEKLQKETQELLKKEDCPTSLCIRTLADRIAIHRKTKGKVFLYEAKTHESKKFNDLTLELVPIIHHKLRSEKMDVRCLYIYRNPYPIKDISGMRLIECGFWINKMPPIREIKIPTWRWTPEEREWFKNKATEFFPDVRIYPTDKGASGDPFIIIDESEVSKLKHWKRLIKDFLLEGINNARRTHA